MAPAQAPGLDQVQVPPDAGGDESRAMSAVGAASTARYGAAELETFEASSGFCFSVGACGTATGSPEDRPQCGQIVTTGGASGMVAASKGCLFRRMIG